MLAVAALQAAGSCSNAVARASRKRVKANCKAVCIILWRRHCRHIVLAIVELLHLSVAWGSFSTAAAVVDNDLLKMMLAAAWGKTARKYQRASAIATEHLISVLIDGHQIRNGARAGRPARAESSAGASTL